jgi:hypothetical protein
MLAHLRQETSVVNCKSSCSCKCADTSLHDGSLLVVKRSLSQTCPSARQDRRIQSSTNGHRTPLSEGLLSESHGCDGMIQSVLNRAALVLVATLRDGLRHLLGMNGWQVRGTELLIEFRQC